MTQLAAQFTRRGARDIPVAPSPAALPVPLVIPPGVYAIGGTNYDCRSFEGLIKVVATSGTTNRVVFSTDPYALMSGLCWLCTHGDEEERVSGEPSANWITRMGTVSKSQKLRLRCGPTVEFVSWFVNWCGFEVRTVRWLTMQDPTGQPWQGVDEGHVTMEVKIGGSWRNFDPDLGAFYTNAGGEHVAARALPPIVADDSFVIERLDADVGYAAEAAEANEYDHAGWYEVNMLRDDGQGDGGRRWVRRICQAVGIDHPANGETWFVLPPGAENRAAWVSGLSPAYKIKTQAEFDAQFYP